MRTSENMQLKACVVLLLFLLHASSSSQAASCTFGDLEASDRWQQIQSPEYPRPFPAQTQCSWRITAPSGQRVKLQFSGFLLIKANPAGKCSRQWLNIMFDEKVADVPGKYYTICGDRNPGTIVTPGSVLRLNLHSGASAMGMQYTGFQASYSQTSEAASLPGSSWSQFVEGARSEQNFVRGAGVKRLEAPALELLPFSEMLPTKTGDLVAAERETSVPSGPTRETLGSVLNRLRQNSGTNSRRRPVSQNNYVEELNRRRNLGLPVKENPYFLSNGQRADQAGVVTTRRPRRTTSYSPEPYRPRPKRTRPLSNEVKTVIIVIAIIVAFFIVFLLMRKLGVFRRIAGIGSKVEGNVKKSGYVHSTLSAKKASKRKSNAEQAESALTCDKGESFDVETAAKRSKENQGDGSRRQRPQCLLEPESEKNWKREKNMTERTLSGGRNREHPLKHANYHSAHRLASSAYKSHRLPEAEAEYRQTAHGRRHRRMTRPHRHRSYSPRDMSSYDRRERK